MTNQSPIECVKAMLDKRGIEYAESQDRFRTRFRFNYCEACDDYLDEIEVMGACITASKSYLTPEQAIAATLGDADYERKMDALLCRLTNGKFSKSRAYDLDFMESCVNEEFEMLYTDELNATLDGEECEWELEHSGPLYDKWRCSKCKFLFVEPRCDQGYTDLVPNYCPRCRTKVKR